MATIQLLQSLKNIDGKDLFVAKFSDEVEIIFSLLSIKQASQIYKILELNDNPSLEYYIYKYIFDECVTDSCIAKTDISLPAGIEVSIGQTVLFLSGVSEEAFDYTSQLLDLYRINTKSALNVMKSVICAAYGGYTFKQLDELNYQELVEIFTLAEQSLIDRGIIENIVVFSRPGEEQPGETIEQRLKRDMEEFNEFNTPKVKQRIDVEKLKRIQQQRILQRQRGG